VGVVNPLPRTFRIHTRYDTLADDDVGTAPEVGHAGTDKIGAVLEGSLQV